MTDAEVDLAMAELFGELADTDWYEMTRKKQREVFTAFARAAYGRGYADAMSHDPPVDVVAAQTYLTVSMLRLPVS